MGTIQVARCLLCLIPFALIACGGPRPVIERVETHAGPTYEVDVTVFNRGGGSGQAELTARLVDSSTRVTAAQVTRGIDLHGHERLNVALSLEPARPGPYRTVVEVHYPEE